MPTTDATFRGRLKALSIADLLVFLKGLNRPGRLLLRRDDTEVMLDLRGGFVVRVASTRAADRVEAILLALGCITPAQHEEARGLESRDPEAGMGRALIACGALTPKGLIEARREQARRIVVSLFDWSDGEYRFDEGRVSSGWTTPVDLPIVDLVAAGVRAASAAELFRERIPSPDWVFEPVAGGTNGSVRLEPQEEHVLGLLDGTTTVEEIESGTEFTDIETRRILFLLLTLGRIRPRPETPVPGEEAGEAMAEIVRRFNGIYSRVYQYLTLELGPISESLLTASLRDVEAEHAPLFQRSRLGGDGTLDEGILGDNLKRMARVRRRTTLVQGLSELLYRQLLVLRQSLGPDHERRVLHELRREGLLARPAPVETL